MHAAGSPAGPIVGREDELAQLFELTGAPGPPAAAFIEGPAGIGKTALLETVAAHAADAGAEVLWARPTAAEAGARMRPWTTSCARSSSGCRCFPSRSTTLALILSGSALLIAAGAAGISGHDRRRIGRA